MTTLLCMARLVSRAVFEAWRFLLIEAVAKRGMPSEGNERNLIKREENVVKGLLEDDPYIIRVKA